MSEKKLGRYDLQGLLGQGGMGSVFKAQDTRLGRTVAIKVMNIGQSASPDAVSRFEREGQSLASLQHPNIVTVYDFCELDGNLCLVMELIDGQPLDQLIDRHIPLSVSQKLGLMAWVCRALEYAHGKGVIHRDLKPANILVTGNRTPKIVDFGIAKMMGQNITRASVMMGTVAYMAPEQINGTAVTPQTDVYSAGVTLYELLTGVQPFESGDTTQTMRRILLDPTPALPPSLPGVPHGIYETLSRALAKDPHQRITSAGEFASLLEAGVHQLAAAEQGHPPQPWLPPQQGGQGFVPPQPGPQQGQRHPSGPHDAPSYLPPQAGPVRHPSGPNAVLQPLYGQTPPGRHPSGPHNAGPGYEGYGQVYAAHRPVVNNAPASFGFPDPPNIPWFIVILLSAVSCGIGMLVWEMTVARWLKNVEPASDGWNKSLIAACCFGGYFLLVCMGALMTAANPYNRQAAVGYNVMAFFALIAYVVMVFVLRMSMRAGIERHFNTAEPIGLRLSPPMSFFFGGIYFAYHFNLIVAHRQRVRMGNAGVRI